MSRSNERARLAPVLPLVPAVVLAAVSVGCTSVSETYRDPRTFPPTKAADVKVAVDAPARPRVLVASLEVSDRGTKLTRDELLALLRDRAARLGGDTLVVYASANRSRFAAEGILVGSAPTVRQNILLADVFVTRGLPAAPGGTVP